MRDQIMNNNMPLKDPPEVLRELCNKWWDIQAEYCVMLNADGWTDDEIATALGIPLEDVTKCLYPVDSTFWDGFMCEFFKGTFMSESLYRAEVQEAIARLRAVAYRGACACAAIEGREHLKGELERGQHCYKQEAKIWKEKGWGKAWDYGKDDRVTVLAVRFVAWDAARLALGIADPNEFEGYWLHKRYLEYDKMIEARLNHRRYEYDEKTGKVKWVEIEDAASAQVDKKLGAI